jgi:pilus assembly protein Flp/PilA
VDSQCSAYKKSGNEQLNENPDCFLDDERGQDIVEYALIAALVALAAIAAVGRVGSAVSSVFTTVGTKITNSV